MAGTSLELFTKKLQALIDGEVMDALKKQLAEQVRSLVLEGFQKSASPYGQYWQQSVQRKSGARGPGEILINTGRLRNSIVAQATETGVRVGTNVVYAAAHNFGYRQIPQRQFLPDQVSGLGNWLEPLRKTINKAAKTLAER